MNRRQFPRFLDLRRHHAAQARDAGQGVPRGMQESPEAAGRVGEVLHKEAGSAVKKPPVGGFSSYACWEKINYLSSSS